MSGFFKDDPSCSSRPQHSISSLTTQSDVSSLHFLRHIDQSLTKGHQDASMKKPQLDNTENVCSFR
jgi:hypothetical protein